MPAITENTWREWNVLSSSIRQGYVTTGELDDIITTLNGGEYNPAQLSEVLEQLPEMVEVKNLKYETTEVMYKSKTLFNGEDVRTGIPEPSYNISSQINSNVGQGVAARAKTVQTNRVLTMTKDATTGKASISDELFKYRGGSPTPTRAKMVAANIASGVVATGVGISLGKTISKLAYDSGFNWLACFGVEMEYLNPETWSTITADGNNGLPEAIFNTVFDLDPTTGNPTMYIDENAFAYLTAYMIETGVFGGDVEIPSYTPITPAPLNYNYDLPLKLTPMCSLDFTRNEPLPPSVVEVKSYTKYYGANAKSFVIKTGDDWFYRCNLSDVDTTFYYDVHAEYSNGNTIDRTYESVKNSVVVNGHTYYFSATGTHVDPDTVNTYIFSPTPIECSASHGSISSVITDIINLTYNNDDAIEQEGVDGITDQTSATQFDTSGISDATNIAAVLLALKNQFPELWENRVEFSPDGETTKTYIPVAFPTGGTSAQPTSQGATQAQPSPQIDTKGDNVSEELVKSLIDMLTKNSPALNTDATTPASIGGASPNDFNTGTGSSPAVVTPVGSASALWKIYNPSQSELNTFGAWLWSSNFVDQLLKIFNDPMQAIIGLHKIFCTPSVSGSGPIKVGYLASNATANYVDDQYADVDCGSVDLYEFYGNVFDYEPFTRLQLFLPFIGFVDLSTSDCMRGKIKVKYRVDVLTGQCLATVSVVRDMHENILYTYTGNCAVQYPVSSGSYIGVIGGLLGIAGTVATGGKAAPIAIRAIKGIGGIHTDVKHSGSIQGSSGAMGCKKPYLVIERPQTAMPNNGELLEGLPENETVKISQLTGYVKVKKAEFDISCTNEELEMIKEMMLEGFHI